MDHETQDNRNDFEDALDTGSEGSAPAEPDKPEPQKVQIPCGGCGTVYTFEVENASSFTFQCRKCGTTSHWEE